MQLTRPRQNKLPPVSGRPLPVDHNLGFTKFSYFIDEKVHNYVCKVIRRKRAFTHSWSSGRSWIHVIIPKKQTNIIMFCDMK